MYLRKPNMINNNHGLSEVDQFVIDVNGFEGPLHLLLELSKTQKVDLLKISLLDLVEQYLSFIQETELLKLEIAADYLIMAAYLLYLKSKLLLPPDPSDDSLTAEELSENLKFQLLRLDAMRKAGIKLMARDQLGRDFFARGKFENVQEKRQVSYHASMIDLLQAYARLKTKEFFEPYHLKQSLILTPEEAFRVVSRMIDIFVDWTSFEKFLPECWKSSPKERRTATATTFLVSLELARTGQLEMRQEETFAPIFLRKKHDMNNLGT